MTDQESVGAGTIPELVNTYQQLTNKVVGLGESIDRSERRRTLQWSLMAVLLIIAIIVPLYIRHLGAGSRESIRQVKDCTTVGGVCYERSRQQTADAVAEIARQNKMSNLELTVCLQKNPDDEKALRECAAG